MKCSFVMVVMTAALHFAVVLIGDATTAIPLWIAFTLAKRKPSKTCSYGLGRIEDLAGLLVVLIILFSAIVAGYEAVSRLLHPQPVTRLGWLATAGFAGFVGNEAVASSAFTWVGR